MDSNNWRSTPPVGESNLDTGDWRTQLQPDSRQRIVNKIMDTLKRHLPFSGQDGLNELKKIAGRFEEKIYTAASSQSDYLQKISLKMLSMESKSQNAMPNSLQSNNPGSSNRPPDPGSMQSQVHNQGHSLPIPLSANQSQARQQLLSQNIQTNMSSAGVQGSSGLSSALPSVSGLSQSPMPSIVGQNVNMQNMSGISPNSVGNSMGQGPSNHFANSQRQIQGRQQVLPQQQQQQSWNSQQFLYHWQYPQQLLNKKLEQGGLLHSLMQPQIPQQPQQQPNLLQPNQLQSSQESGMQTSSVMSNMMQSAPLPGLQSNQQPSVQQSTQPMTQQHPQSVLRPRQQQQQTVGIHQQQTPMAQQSVMPQQQQQQQQLMGKQPNTVNMHQIQLIGQQNNVGDMQQQLRLLGQQSNLPNLQQQQQQQQLQQLMAQQNLSSMHHQQLGPQSNVSGLQQQLLGTQSGSSSMQTNQHPAHMLQQPKVPLQQQMQQSAPNLLPNQGQQQQSQSQQQQMMSQIQSQPTQLQQQLDLQQQSNPLQRDMQQRLRASGQASASLLQPQNVMDQQKQLYQPQRALLETSSTSLDSTNQTGQANGVDWQEEVYQKIKTMREVYLPELNEMYQKIATKLQQHDSLPQQPKSDQLEKLKIFKTMLERIISFLQVSKSGILPGFKETLGSYEKQIVNFISTNRPRKPVSSLQQQVQLPQTHMHSMQQEQSQISQEQPRDDQMNSQIQSMNLAGSMVTMQPNNVTNVQHNSVPSVTGVSTSQQNMLNSVQRGPNTDLGQGTSLSSMHQVNVGSLQQNSVSASQQASINNLPSQSGVNMLQSNINPLQLNSNMMQPQHWKQQHLMQFQQQQQHQQQQHQQAKQQLPAQLPTHQMPQLNQMNGVNDLKIRQGMAIKPGVFQQHLTSGQHSAYSHQQLKPGAQFPISSPQLLQTASPQMPQHSSPQVDQQNLLQSITKNGTPLQSENSPFVIPSPSTPMVPSPMPGDSEKPISGFSSLSNAGNIGHQQTTSAQAADPSLAIGTPGISASPLLSQFTGSNGSHGNALTTISIRASVTEQPLECLTKAEMHNASNKTPRGVFTETHKELFKEGEKLMKDTAQSCTVVVSLIIIVVFAAAFTVLGGKNREGIPNFLGDVPFIVFITSDALALFSATTSLLIFLGISTSHYPEEDLLVSLPRKLMIGLLSMFFSIAAMMVAVGATI